MQQSMLHAPQKGCRPFSQGPCVQRFRPAQITSRPSAHVAHAATQGDGQQQAPPMMSRRDVLASQLLLVAGAVMPQAAFASEREVAAALYQEEVAGSAQQIEAINAEVASTPLAPAAPSLGKGETKVLTDPILAYTFEYPTVSTAGLPLSMQLSRIPEKYSSAAPLTADARQRIVGELFDFRRFVGASVNVGPPPPGGLLSGKTPAEWSAKEVALTVLIDRSTARTTAGQRVALNDVVRSEKVVKSGQEYWVYEHVSQGSPTIANRKKESYRHALAVTGWRAAMDGTPYLYTLNMSCPEELWPELQPLFQRGVDTFTLLQPTNDYIPPDKDPWLFF